MAFFRRRLGMRAEEAARASVPFNYGPRCRSRALRPHRGGHRAAARAPVRRARLPRAGASPRACTTATAAWRGIDVPTLVVHGRHDRMIPVANAQLIAERVPGAPPADPRGVRPPVRDRGARGRRRDRRVPRGGGGGPAVSVAMALGDELRVADVIRRQARRAWRRHRDPARLAGAHLPRARRALQPARAGAARRWRRPGLARRAPRPDGARGHRAALRGEQDRRRARAAQLAAGGARAHPHRGRRRRAAADRRQRVRGRGIGDRGRAAVAAAHGRGGTGLRAVGRRPRSGRPRRSRCLGRHGRADVHVRHHRCPQGRPHHAPQPRGRRRDVAALGLRRRHGQPHAAADVPHRRHRLGVPRPVERREHDPGQRVRGRSRARRARARARNQRGLRPDDAADARGRAGRRASATTRRCARSRTEHRRSRPRCSRRRCARFAARCSASTA